MQIIKFIETCTVPIKDEYNLLDSDFVSYRTFLSGDEETVESVAEDGDESMVSLGDGTIAVVPTDHFVLVNCEDEKEMW
jgi:hypothetical protein